MRQLLTAIPPAHNARIVACACIHATSDTSAEAYLPLCDERIGAAVAVVDSTGESERVLGRWGTAVHGNLP